MSILNNVDVRVYPCLQSTVWTLVFPPNAVWICRVYSFSSASSVDVRGVSLYIACSVAVQRVTINSPCSVVVQGVSLSTASSEDVPGVSLSTACCMDDRVYPTYTNSSVDVKGVSLFPARRKDL
jgi:hypothetical protein